MNKESLLNERFLFFFIFSSMLFFSALFFPCAFESRLKVRKIKIERTTIAA